MLPAPIVWILSFYTEIDPIHKEKSASETEFANNNNVNSRRVVRNCKEAEYKPIETTTAIMKA